MAKKVEIKDDFITKEEYQILDNILNKIRLKFKTKIIIKDTTDGSIIIQTFDKYGIIRHEAKTKSIKASVNFLYNKIY
jgi:hypothetical protein